MTFHPMGPNFFLSSRTVCNRQTLKNTFLNYSFLVWGTCSKNKDFSGFSKSFRFCLTPLAADIVSFRQSLSKVIGKFLIGVQVKNNRKVSLTLFGSKEFRTFSTFGKKLATRCKFSSKTQLPTLDALKIRL